MYWCRYRFKTIFILFSGVILANSLVSCRPDIKENSASQKYFDIKGYFTAEINHLSKLNRAVTKTATHNGITESKKVRIDNWAQELDLFVTSDINKPAWKNSYSVTTGDGVTIYKTNDPELKTKEIMIKQDGQKVKWILIYNSTKNILYQNSEELTYYPDSLYLIQKGQLVKVIGQNLYRIRGVIDK